MAKHVYYFIESQLSKIKIKIKSLADAAAADKHGEYIACVLRNATWDVATR